MTPVDCLPVDLGAFERDLASFGPSFYDRDSRAALEIHARALEQVPCLESVPSPGLVATLHRVHGMASFFSDSGAIVPAFVAARRADPGAEIPPGAALETDHIRRWWERTLDLDEPALIVAPANGLLWVDGSRTSERYDELPALVQLVDARGAVRYSTYLLPGDQPDFSGIGRLPPLVLQDPGSWTARHFRPATMPLWIGALSTGAAAGASYAVAVNRRVAFDDLTVPRTEAELTALRTQVNTADAIARAGLATSVALAVVGGLTIRW